MTRRHGGDRSNGRGEPSQRTSLEVALGIGDYWRLKCVALLEENHLLRRRVAAAVAEALRLGQAEREAPLRDE